MAGWLRDGSVSCGCLWERRAQVVLVTCLGVGHFQMLGQIEVDDPGGAIGYYKLFLSVS